MCIEDFWRVDLRELPVKAEKYTFETPDIANVPYPVHECQFGTKDHGRNLVVRDEHGRLGIQSNVVSENP